MRPRRVPVQNVRGGMKRLLAVREPIASFAIIVFAYVLCHGITAFAVTPVQRYFLADITIFASLVYLPHGVRVLATWLFGSKAFFPLLAGATLAEILFTPDSVRSHLDPAILESIAVGAFSAPLSFEILRLFGRNLYAKQARRISWKWLILAGALASGINSVGQSIVFRGLILPDEFMSVLAIYAIGDLVGLIVTMIVLMMIFRWIRMSDSRI